MNFPEHALQYHKIHVHLHKSKLSLGTQEPQYEHFHTHMSVHHYNTDNLKVVHNQRQSIQKLKNWSAQLMRQQLQYKDEFFLYKHHQKTAFLAH